MSLSLDLVWQQQAAAKPNLFLKSQKVKTSAAVLSWKRQFY
jgi:hypothetical protein